MKPPHRNEYESAYLENYIKLVPDEDVLNVLASSLESTQQLLNNLTEAKGNFRYADGKWSVKEVLGHIIDTERVFAYRAFCIARGEKNSLPGFEQDDYVKEGHFDTRTLKDLLNEYRAVRESSLILYKSFTEDNLSAKGVANGKAITPRVIVYITAGHELHHINVLKEKYLI